MFAGEYKCTVDGKGRFILPAPFRDLFQNPESTQESKGIIFLKGQEPSLWLYRLEDWQNILGRTRAKLDDDQSRLFMHFIVSESLTSEIDKNGRICIPKRLRDYAQIDTEVTVVGLYERLEIWSPPIWTSYLSRIEETHETALSKILNIL